jgi:hypothetical protein
MTRAGALVPRRGETEFNSGSKIARAEAKEICPLTIERGKLGGSRAIDSMTV